jgi:hypothetical protein
VQPTTDPNDPLYRHGVGTSVAVTDANGDTYYVDCEAQEVVELALKGFSRPVSAFNLTTLKG